MSQRVNAVIYEPLSDDEASGRILWSTQAPAGALALESRPWIATEVFNPEYDRTHKVVASRLVSIDD